LILFVGRLEPGKRPALFLEVIENLRDRVAFEACIVGDGPLRGSLKRRAGACGVNLLGVRTDVPELMRRASVLVMTSATNTEGMPGVLVEAGLSGLPVVSTRAAGVSDVVVNDQTGFATSDDPAELANRVEYLLTNATVCATTGEQAREQSIARFSIAATATRWKLLTTALTAGGRR
jgi:glycosyltransferase involved in cell wall biosynthesis